MVPKEIERILNHSVNKSSKTLEVRLARTNEDLTAAREVTIDAFMEYAMFLWMLEDIEGLRSRRSAVGLFVKIIQQLCIWDGMVLIAKDKSTGQIVGCAQISHRQKPKNALANVFNSLGLFFYFMFHLFFGAIGFPWFIFRVPMRKFSRRGKACSALDENHEKVLDASKDHFHLIQIATFPETQSKGVGGILLDSLKAIQEEYHLPVYLETDTERHRTYYERHGFEVEISYDVDAGKGDVFKPNYGMVRWI